MAEKKHLYEEIVDAVVQDFWAEFETIVEFLKTEGRPIFHHKLTEQEQLMRFLDTTLNPDVSTSVIDKMGADALNSYQLALRRQLERRLPR